MKIKVKVKTLILTAGIFAVIFVWGIPAALFGIADYLDSKGSDKALLFYEKYAYYPTTPSIEGKFVYADKLIKGFDKYTIFLDGWGGLGSGTDNLEEAKDLLEDIVHSYSYNKYENSRFTDSYKMLMDISIATGDAKMLRKWIEFGQQYNNDNIKYISDTYNGFLMHVNGDNKGASEIISKYEGTEYADVKLDILKMELAIFDGNYDKAELISEKIRNTVWNSENKMVFGSSRYYERGYWMDEFSKIISGRNTIRGTVTYEGHPMPFVEIYVQDARGGMRSGGDNYIAVTDENGCFQTIGLKDGTYSIGIGLDASLLEDKVLSRSGYEYVTLDGKGKEMNFVFNKTINVNSPEAGEKISGNEFTVSWEEAEGADYYTVQAVIFSNPYEKNGTSISTPIYDKNGKTRFTGNYAVFDTDKLKTQPIGISYDGDEMLLGYEGVLGCFLPGIEYPITVNACDKNGKIITSSLPMRTYYDKIPSIEAEGRLTDGENIIMNKNYTEAIKYYENILMNEPDNTDALLYLTKIYGLGWKKGERNIERAIELGLNYADVSGDINVLFGVLDAMRDDEIKENKKLIYSAVKKAGTNPGPEGYRLLSRCYIADENWEEAREALTKIDYVSEDLFYLNLYFGNYPEAAENLKKLYTSQLTTYKISESVLELAHASANVSDKEIFNSFLLKIVSGVDHNDGEYLYRQTTSKIKNENIKDILYAIYLEKNWDTVY